MTYTIPSSPVTLKEVELELNETKLGLSRRIVIPALENGSIPIKDLISGNGYTVRIRGIATDGRKSDFTPVASFKTSKVEFSYLSYY